MKYEFLYNGERLPRLGLGTWRLGGDSSPDRTRDAENVQLIWKAIDLGYTLIDTAEMYGGGHTEHLIGEAIQGFDRRGLFVMTKVWRSNLHYRDVIRAVEASLKRLRSDYVDLYMIHWPNPAVNLEETFRALNELVANGLVRHLGVSNFDLPLLKQARRLSKTPLACVQVRYSLLHRMYVRNGVLEYCQGNDIVLTAYSPVKGGVLNHPVVAQIAEKYSATPAQVALNWLIRQPKVVTIPMTRNPQHLKENLGALDLQLDPDDLEQLANLV